MSKGPAATQPNILPIIVGGDIGGYSVARAFHAAFGIPSVILAGALTGPVSHSRIARVLVTPNLDDDSVLVGAVAEVIAAHPGKACFVFGAADWHVEAVVRNRAAWPEAVVPYVDEPTLNRATDKVAFGEACVASGVPYPQTVVIRGGGDEVPNDLTYPVVAKAASTSAFHEVTYPGKHKVFYAQSRDELVSIVDAARAGGYAAPFLVQRRIAGADDHMRVATCFVAQDGTVSDEVVGRVLLEEHTPGALGNPAAIVAEPFPDVVEGMHKLVAALGWKGHANFDVKWDDATGEHVFFELNPRLGRSNFYLQASGVNPAIALAREFAGVEGGRPASIKHGAYSILPFPLVWWLVKDKGLRSAITRLWIRRRFLHPLWYPADRSLRRWGYVQAAKLNHYRKFARYYRVSEEQA